MEDRVPEQIDNKMARWAEVMRWFDRWLEADEAGRVCLLAELQDNDAQLYALLLRAIKIDREAEAMRFLDVGAMAEAARSENTENTVESRLGECIGPWRVEHLLGVGGMGQVWRVVRNDGRHTGHAALKMLRFTALNHSARLRFAREAELLARLQHPHVARLLDVGEAIDHQPYLVLEYVNGQRIDDWCDRARADVPTRLRLFLQVCDAIAYAHANLIVHRDLKPSNVLVEPDGSAKVLDFGMAKLLESEELSSELTELTRAAGAAFTPEYAAPEQFEGQPVTVATDVYSLGVVLYVLLAGKRPFEETTPRQLARCVVDGVPRRLAQALEHTQNTGRIASLRSTTPQTLGRMLRGDLDTILGKALKRDPAERYASVQALADDVQRWLDHKPIRARAETALYRTRMFVKRHRGSVAVGCIMLLSLLMGSGTLLVQDYRLQMEVKRANTIKQFLLDAISNVDPYFANDQPALDAVSLLKKAAIATDSELPADDATRAEVYERLGKLLARFVQFDDAEKLNRKAAEAYRRMEGEYSLRAIDAEASAIAGVLDRGEVAQAQKQTEDLLVRIAAIPNPQDARLARLRVLLRMAFDADQVGNLLLAHDWAQRAATELRPDVEAERSYYANAHRRLAVVALQGGAVRVAAPSLYQLVTFSLKLHEADPVRDVLYLHYLLWSLFEQGNYADARPVADAAIELIHRQSLEHASEIVQIYTDRAEVEAGLGDEVAAERDFEAAQAYADDLFRYKPYDRAQLALHYGFGMYLAERDRFDEAASQLAACQRTLTDIPNNWHNVRAVCAVGAAYSAAHRGNDASMQVAAIDQLIVELRAHAARDLPRALSLRARLSVEGIATDSPRQQLAWLDEARALLDQSGRGGSLLARQIEARRVALGGTPSAPQLDSGRKLVDAANAIIAAPQ